MSSAAPSYREKPPKLIGGVLCLDYVNTVSWRGDPRDRGERLTSYAELLHWAVHAGILDRRASRRLAEEAESRPQAARAVLVSAIDLREALATLLSRSTRARPAVAAFNAMLSAAPSRLAIRPCGSGFAWEGGSGDGALDRPLHAVLWSAADLLTSGQLSRVRACGDARCSWLFLDASPGGRRRWCSMKECGNRAKVRRHHRARKAKSRRSRAR